MQASDPGQNSHVEACALLVSTWHRSQQTRQRIFFFRRGRPFKKMKKMTWEWQYEARPTPGQGGRGPGAARLIENNGRSPAETCRYTHADRRTRLFQTVLPPLHPLRSIRRSQGRGVSRQIALHTWQLFGPTVPCPDNSVIRSRRPADSAFASESHLQSPGGISGPAGHPARPTVASLRGSPVSMHMLARGQPTPSICWRNPKRPLAARRESPF